MPCVIGVIGVPHAMVESRIGSLVDARMAAGDAKGQSAAVERVTALGLRTTPANELRLGA